MLIKAPIAPETGLDHCIAGLSCAGGRPDRVLYGIPARYTPEPPPGQCFAMAFTLCVPQAP